MIKRKKCAIRTQRSIASCALAEVPKRCVQCMGNVPKVMLRSSQLHNVLNLDACASVSPQDGTCTQQKHARAVHCRWEIFRRLPNHWHGGRNRNGSTVRRRDPVKRNAGCLLRITQVQFHYRTHCRVCMSSHMFASREFALSHMRVLACERSDM